MSDKYEKVRLGDICKYRTSKELIKNIVLDDYISTTNMLPNRDGIVKIEEFPSGISVNQYKVGDILISNIRPYFKKIWYADKNGTCSNDVLVFEVMNVAKYNKRYIYYNLYEDRFFNHMMAGSKGTKMPRGNKNQILDFEINLPPLETQEKIANILSSLDDKIENNKKTAEKLEEIAQTLFNRWFVEFNFPNENGKPYKENGGEMVESELGLIPKGWEVIDINNFTTEMKNGSTPSRKRVEYWNDKEIRWLKSGEVRNNVIISTEEYISKEGLNNSSAKVLNKNTVIIALYGATAGKVGLLKTETTTNQACCAMLCDKANTSIYLYNFLKYKNEYIKGLAIGAAQQNLSKDTISKLKIIAPKEYILERVPFDNLYSKIEYCLREIEKLQTLRDTLLPKLMSGEIEI